MALNRSLKHQEVMLKYARNLRTMQTSGETILWDELRGRKLYGWKFKRQWPILIDLQGAGTFVVADFYCAAAKLIIEVDGGVHQGQKLADELRDQALADRGYAVMRVPDWAVKQCLNQVLSQIEGEVKKRALTRAARKNIPLLLL